MQIAIDATPVVKRRKGIGSVLDGLISAASPGSVLGSALLFVDASFADEAAARWPGRVIEPVSFRSSLWWETFQLPRLLRRHHAEVLLTLRERTVAPSGTRSFVWLFEDPSRRESVARQQRVPRSVVEKAVGRYAATRLQRVARMGARFIVSSQFTQRDLMSSYRVNANRITVIHPGLATEFRNPFTPAVAAAHDYGRYVLHFATGDPRDNSVVAMEAFAAAASRVDARVNLVLAGVPASHETTLAGVAERLNIGSRIRIRGYVPAAELPSLYANADVYLDPTLLEGFGLQIAEAMACGIPVISSAVSAVPEVFGDAALLFAPSDHGAFATALAELLVNEEKRKLLGARGRELAGQFTWDVAVKKIEQAMSTL